MATNKVMHLRTHSGIDKSTESKRQFIAEIGRKTLEHVRKLTAVSKNQLSSHLRQLLARAKSKDMDAINEMSQHLNPRAQQEPQQETQQDTKAEALDSTV